MPNSDERMVRGLSIAVLVLSILAMVAMLGLLGLLGLGGIAISDPDIANSVALNAQSDPVLVDELGALDLNSEDIIGLTALGFGAATIGTVWIMICALFSLIAASVGMRNYNQPQKIGRVFGWAVTGAIFTLLGGLIVQTILLVITAVYANKLRKSSTTIPYGQPQPQYTQQGYAQTLQQGYQQQPPYGENAAQPQPPIVPPEHK